MGITTYEKRLRLTPLLSIALTHNLAERLPAANYVAQLLSGAYDTGIVKKELYSVKNWCCRYRFEPGLTEDISTIFLEVIKLYEEYNQKITPTPVERKPLGEPLEGLMSLLADIKLHKGRAKHLAGDEIFLANPWDAVLDNRKTEAMNYQQFTKKYIV